MDETVVVANDTEGLDTLRKRILEDKRQRHSRFQQDLQSLLQGYHESLYRNDHFLVDELLETKMSKALLEHQVENVTREINSLKAKLAQSSPEQSFIVTNTAKRQATLIHKLEQELQDLSMELARALHEEVRLNNASKDLELAMKLSEATIKSLEKENAHKSALNTQLRADLATARVSSKERAISNSRLKIAIQVQEKEVDRLRNGLKEMAEVESSLKAELVALKQEHQSAINLIAENYQALTASVAGKLGSDGLQNERTTNASTNELQAAARSQLRATPTQQPLASLISTSSTVSMDDPTLPTSSGVISSTVQAPRVLPTENQAQIQPLPEQAIHEMLQQQMTALIRQENQLYIVQWHELDSLLFQVSEQAQVQNLQQELRRLFIKQTTETQIMQQHNRQHLQTSQQKATSHVQKMFQQPEEAPEDWNSILQLQLDSHELQQTRLQNTHEESEAEIESAINHAQRQQPESQQPESRQPESQQPESQQQPSSPRRPAVRRRNQNKPPLLPIPPSQLLQQQIQPQHQLAEPQLPSQNGQSKEQLPPPPPRGEQTGVISTSNPPQVPVPAEHIANTEGNPYIEQAQEGLRNDVLRRAAIMNGLRRKLIGLSATDTTNAPSNESPPAPSMPNIINVEPIIDTPVAEASCLTSTSSSVKTGPCSKSDSDTGGIIVPCPQERMPQDRLSKEAVDSTCALSGGQNSTTSEPNDATRKQAEVERTSTLHSTNAQPVPEPSKVCRFMPNKENSSTTARHEVTARGEREDLTIDATPVDTSQCSPGNKLCPRRLGKKRRAVIGWKDNNFGHNDKFVSPAPLDCESFEDLDIEPTSDQSNMTPVPSDGQNLSAPAPIPNTQESTRSKKRRLNDSDGDGSEPRPQLQHQFAKASETLVKPSFLPRKKPSAGSVPKTTRVLPPKDSKILTKSTVPSSATSSTVIPNDPRRVEMVDLTKTISTRPPSMKTPSSEWSSPGACQAWSTLVMSMTGKESRIMKHSKKSSTDSTTVLSDSLVVANGNENATHKGPVAKGMTSQIQLGHRRETVSFTDSDSVAKENIGPNLVQVGKDPSFRDAYQVKAQMVDGTCVQAMAVSHDALNTTIPIPTDPRLRCHSPSTATTTITVATCSATEATTFVPTTSDVMIRTMARPTLPLTIDTSWTLKSLESSSLPSPSKFMRHPLPPKPRSAVVENWKSLTPTTTTASGYSESSEHSRKEVDDNLWYGFEPELPFTQPPPPPTPTPSPPPTAPPPPPPE